MMNEVQLIAWKKAIEDEVFYTGVCISAQTKDTEFRATIAPIAGVADVTDLRGYWIRLTNELGQSQYFPIVQAQVLSGNWLLTAPFSSPVSYELSEFDFSISTYQIVTREYTGELNNSLLTTGAFFRVNGDQSSTLGKTIQIELETGQKYHWVITSVNYPVGTGQTDIGLLGSFSPPAPSINGTWSIVFETSPYYLELYPNESISQNWRFTDISNFGTTGSFSREFRIPATENNSFIFGIVEEVNFNDELNYFHTKLKAEIRVSTFPIAIGHIRLMKTYTQDGKYSDLQLSFYAETPDLQRAIGDAKLKELSDLPLLNHPLTHSIVTGSEAIIATGNILGLGGVGATSIRIPEQSNLGQFVGSTIRLINGANTTTRPITSASEYTSSQDEIGWSIGLNQNYVGGTWELIDSQLFNNVQYALVDRGQKWDETTANGTRPISDSNIPLYAGDMTPHLNAWWIFTNILKDAGFSLNPTPLQSILQSYWSPWINSSSIQVNNQDTGYLFRAQYTSTQLLDFGQTFNNVPEIYDNNGDLFAGAIYQPPFPASYTFRVWLTFTPVNLFDAPQSISFRVRNAQDPSLVYFTHSVFISEEDAIAQIPINVQFTTNAIFLLPMTGADGVIVEVRTLYNNTPFYGSAVYDPFNATGWELVKIENVAYGAVMQMNQNAPDVKQIDFVKDIINMHCCAIVPDTFKPSVLNIIPMVDYVNSGNTLDWTDKLDISKDIILNPTTDRQKKNILFTYKNGGDFISKVFSDNGRTYGEYKIEGYQVNPDEPVNDFADGDLKIQLTAESNPCNFIAGTSLVISKYRNDKGDFVTPNLRFVYMSDIGLVKLYDEVSEAVLESAVNVTNHYSDSYATISDFDLNFAPETPLHVIEENPFKNLFNLYWRDYMNELYSPKARILEASFALDVMDVQSFSFADKIWVKDSYWRILEITDYKVGMNESTRVVLIKTDMDSPDCTSIPFQSSSNGFIQFEDFDGNPVPPSASCCIRYGYTWNSQLNQCLGRGQGSSEPSDPTGGGSAMMVMQGQKNQPALKIAMVTGSNVSPDNNWSSYVGRDITIPANNPFTTAQGDFLQSKEGQPSSALLGSNTLAPIKGLHFGGGWRGQRLSSAIGSQQSGFIVLGNSKVFNSDGDSIEVFVGNETITRLNLDSKTQWSCIMNIHISDHSGFWAYSVYTFTIWKDSIADASTPIQMSIDDSIGNQLEVAPTIDVTSDTSQHRFRIQLNDIGTSIAYLFPTPPVDVVATLQYTQSR
jgi:hypothetical protein